MITLEEALEQKMLRPVDVGNRGFPVSYKDKPFADYKEYIDKDVILVNAEKKFLVVKDKNLASQTFTAQKGNSLIYRDDETLEANVTPKSSDFIRVILNEKSLKTPIIDLSVAKKTILIESFAELAMKVINSDSLNSKQVASLIVDPRTDLVFGLENLLPLIKEIGIKGNELKECLEILKQTTPRARLLVQEIKDGTDKPLSLGLFSTPLIKDLIKLK